MSDELARAIQMAKDNLPFMTKEQIEDLLMTVRAALEAYRKLEGAMPKSAVAEMTNVVDDRLMADIVKDLRHGRSEPGWLPPSKPSGQTVRGTGWSTPKPEDRSRQFAQFDSMVNALVGGPNETSKLK